MKPAVLLFDIDGTLIETGGAGTIFGNHVYADNGTYTVTVTVTDSANNAQTQQLVVAVSPAPPIIVSPSV